MGLVDQVIAGLVLAGALWLLYRSLWKKQGACHGCSSGGCSARPRELVRLGGPPREASPPPAVRPRGRS